MIIGFGIHPLSGAWEIDLIERFRLCLQVCSCYFLHENSSRSAQSGYYQNNVPFHDNPGEIYRDNLEEEG